MEILYNNDSVTVMLILTAAILLGGGIACIVKRKSKVEKIISFICFPFFAIIVTLLVFLLLNRESKSKSDIPMVFVEGGTFTMGCTSEQGDDCWDNEKPAHQVSLSSFYIGQYEVTQMQWKAVMDNNPSYFKSDDLPVERVSWDDVQEFIQKLNTKTNKQYRLPTESEWEFAARGGNRSNSYKYSGSNTVDKAAWYNENSGDTTHPVGSKLPNELGIYDMSGNVYEWCSEGFSCYPRGLSNDSSRMFRGGSWQNVARGTRVSFRDYCTPDYECSCLGFRLACNSK